MGVDDDEGSVGLVLAQQRRREAHGIAQETVEMRLRGGLQCGETARVHHARKRHVELEAVHHVGVAPRLEELAASVVQPSAIAARGLGRVERGAHRLEMMERAFREGGDVGMVARQQRDKVPELADAERHRHGILSSAIGVKTLAQLRFVRRGREAERCAHRGVKSVARRCRHMCGGRGHGRRALAGEG